MRVDLGQGDAGQVRRVRVGDDITVELAENPTTGYRWHAEVDQSRLEITGDRYDGAERPMGAPGMRRLTFTVVQSGPARLHLVKRRAWEQAVVDEYEVALEVAAE